MIEAAHEWPALFEGSSHAACWNQWHFFAVANRFAVGGCPGIESAMLLPSWAGR
jgi:hypothetical protein